MQLKNLVSKLWFKNDLVILLVLFTRFNVWYYREHFKHLLWKTELFEIITNVRFILVSKCLFNNDRLALLVNASTHYFLLLFKRTLKNFCTLIKRKNESNSTWVNCNSFAQIKRTFLSWVDFPRLSDFKQVWCGPHKTFFYILEILLKWK